jgi:hypothetical protein
MEKFVHQQNLAHYRKLDGTRTRTNLDAIWQRKRRSFVEGFAQIDNLFPEA